MTFANSRRARGFTLVELLVVIGVILVLVGIAVYSFSRLDPSEKATKTALANCRAMFAELESTAGIGTTPGEVFSGGRVARSDPTFGDFWMDPIRETPSSNPPTPVANPGATSNTGSDAYHNTVLAMALISKVSGNREAISKLGSKSVLRAGADDPATTTVDETRVPVIADAWGNAILFVPGNGMSSISLGLKADGNWTSTGNTITAPDNRPFFASAGPDGDMGRGDDNVYSFQP